jgi:uridine kinase
MVLIGGPSSSGKTTSARKLCTYLESMGKKPIVISTDDYFVNKKDTPKLENGEYDFESLKAMDLELFNKQMKSLIKAKKYKYQHIIL